MKHWIIEYHKAMCGDRYPFHQIFISKPDGTYQELSVSAILVPNENTGLVILPGGPISINGRVMDVSLSVLAGRDAFDLEDCVAGITVHPAAGDSIMLSVRSSDHEKRR